MGSVHPIRINLLRAELPPASPVYARMEAMREVARADPRLAGALADLTALNLELLDAMAACSGSEQDAAGARSLVEARSAVAAVRRALVRQEETVRQCRWAALHVRMRRVRGLSGPLVQPKPVQAALFDFVRRHGHTVGTTYWTEGAHAA